MDEVLRQLIEKVSLGTDIVAVIGEHVPLDQHHRGKCPFHQDNNPSFSVNNEGQYFHCFGCGASGDAIDFIQRIQSISFMAALRALAQRAAVPFPELNNNGWDRFEDERRTEDILTETAHYYHKTLTPEAKNYLINARGFREDTIVRFRLGYARGGLANYLTVDRGFPLDQCVKAGVLRQKEDGTVRDFFYERLIIPNIKNGRVVHIVGRALGDSEPKYLNLPGPIQYLFNEDALSSKEVLVTEGPADCISASQAGYAAVALMGTHFRPGLLSKLARCSIIYICLDADEAGTKAAIQGGELLGEKARIVILPEGNDLNDYLKSHSKEEFDELLRSAKDIVSHRLDLIPPDTNKMELPDLLEPIFQLLAKMEKPKAEAFLIHGIKERFSLSNTEVSAYRNHLKEIKKKQEGKSDLVGSLGDPKEQYSAYFEGLVDLVEHHGEPAFLIKDDDEYKIVTSVEREGTILVPPPKDKILWLLPRDEEVIKYIKLYGDLGPKTCDAALYDDLREYHVAVSELPVDDYYDLLVPWVMHTYLLEAFQYTPILTLFAVTDRGKSRTGKGIAYVAYRAIIVESLREAYLIRFSDGFKGTLVFDVKNLWTKAERCGSEDILLLRYERGAKVPRVLYPDRGPFQDTVTFQIFGPTIICTNTSLHRILDTRSLQINMRGTEKSFENNVKPEGGQEFKERLVAFRAWHLGKTLPDIPKPARSRLGDILKPLQQILRLVRPEKEPSFIRLTTIFEKERKMERGESFEADIFKIVLSLEWEVKNGFLSIKLITETFNDGKPEDRRITWQRAGKILKAMGFDKHRLNNSQAIYWNQDLINRLIEEYGLSETHDSNETNASDGPSPENT